MSQVMIDYNCHHCHNGDCLGGKGWRKTASVLYRVCRLNGFSLCFNFSLHVLCLSAFICHHNSFLIYGSLEQPTLARWSQITHISVGSALIISAVFAVSGYTTFTGYTQGKGWMTKWMNCFFRLSAFQTPWASFHVPNFAGDIFENYCKDDNLATFGRFCFGLSIITTFPLECFVTREVSDTYSHASLRIERCTWN